MTPQHEEEIRRYYDDKRFSYSILLVAWGQLAITIGIALVMWL